MEHNLKNNSINLTSEDFNNANKENGVNCGDLDSHLNFGNLNDFNATITDLTKLAPTLSAYASCGSYRKTVKQTSKMQVLFLVEKGGKIKEQSNDPKAPRVSNEY